MPTVLLTSRGLTVASVTASSLYSLPFSYSESPHNRYLSRKFHRGFRAYQQNTGATHPSAPKVKREEDSSIGSEPLIDSNWYGSISVGNPAKTLTGELSLLTLNYLERTRQCTVNFDSGTGDFFLPSSNCDSSCKGHILYDASESSTAHDLRTPFDLGYADSSGVHGKLYTDDVTIGGYTVGLCGSPTFPAH